MDFIYRQFQDPDRPVQVTYAIFLLYAYLAIALLASTAQTIARIVLDPEQALQLAAILMVNAMSYLFMFFVARMVAKGRSWARSLLVLGFLFILLMSLCDMRNLLAGDPLTAVLALGQLSITAVAVTLLFQKPSSDWYRSISESKSTPPEPGAEARE